MTFDYLIVGAGFAGAVLAERLAAGANKKVLICDRRPHVGGNAYDYFDAAGILVHKYGPHVFHTDSKVVFDYLSRFTEWRPYEHRVLASVHGQLLPLPINLDTINRLYGLSLTSGEVESFLATRAEPMSEVRTAEDAVVSRMGRDLYDKFFRGYTRKLWGSDPSELDASVTARIPIRTDQDDRCFTDTYQAMPVRGYTRMFEQMLDHPNITVRLGVDYREIADVVPYDEMIYTGAIDAYYDHCYGKLPHRSIDFRHETLPIAEVQPAAVVHYPNDFTYSRVTEFKHMTGQQHEMTSVVYETPMADGEPYYPVPSLANAELYKRYACLAGLEPRVHFTGRLATYRYYDMDQVTAQSLELYADLTEQTLSSTSTQEVLRESLPGENAAAPAPLQDGPVIVTSC